ncbi:Crp/Fnr family transcriptional regulator [Acinetobacter colistiniresistens]|uniref:Crp/Fnr family transcriptional regulator n=1 Tax=Acinetobacter colistiniresistens TaxID=280145 RepID=UPI001C0757B2|nr:Crp/Fnr family transcriptional regulator [Acinetobacter colistiniresistens]
MDPLNVLQSDDVFSLLPLDRINQLTQAARVEDYRTPILLESRGTFAEYLWFVVAGSVDLTLYSKEGGIARLPITQGHWATWAAVFGSKPLEFDFWSAKSTTLIAFPKAEVITAVHDQPKVMLKILEQVSENATLLNTWILTATILTAEQRLAHLLLILSSRQHTSVTKGLKVTREHLGMVGLGTRQRVSRLLGKLVQQGVIMIENGQIVISSRERLEKLALI